MGATNLVTTLREQGLGSSFRADRTYFISTVPQPAYSMYETILKVAGNTGEVLYTSYERTPVEAVMNHIAVTRCAVSNGTVALSKDVISDFKPTQIYDILVAKMGLSNANISLNSEFNQMLLRMSGINYPPKRSLYVIFILLGIFAIVSYGIFKLFTK